MSFPKDFIISRNLDAHQYSYFVVKGEKNIEKPSLLVVL